MIPSKFKEPIPTQKLRSELIKETSKRTGIDIDMVEKVITDQFKNIREATNTCAEVYVYKMGTFNVRQARLAHLIQSGREKMEAYLDVIIRNDELPEGHEDKIDAKTIEEYRMKIAKWDDDIQYMETKVRDKKVYPKRPDCKFKPIQEDSRPVVDVTSEFNFLLD